MVALLELALDAAGYRTVAAADAETAWQVLSTTTVDLVVLDILLPGADGVDLCRRIRASSDVPVILLTALGETSDRVAGLEAGADDYVPKPFSPRELVLRVGAVLRRTTDRRTGPVVATRRAAGALTLDAALGLAQHHERDLHLTASEFRLLWLLAERENQTVPLSVLADALGHDGDDWGARAALRTAIYRLRSKLGATEGAPQIHSDHGVGYRLVTSARSSG